MSLLWDARHKQLNKELHTVNKNSLVIVRRPRVVKPTCVPVSFDRKRFNWKIKGDKYRNFKNMCKIKCLNTLIRFHTAEIKLYVLVIVLVVRRY